MPEGSAPTRTKHVVLARDPDGHLVVVGPVFSEETVRALAEEVRSAGWLVEYAGAPILSRAEFRG